MGDINRFIKLKLNAEKMIIVSSVMKLKKLRGLSQQFCQFTNNIILKISKSENGS